MANYDGPPSGFGTFTVGTLVQDATFYRDYNEVPVWTTQPTFVGVSGFGSGGGATTPEGDPIYGYGWGLSG